MTSLISNEQLVYEKLLDIYPHALSPITALSYNDDGKKNFIMSDEKGFNYDLVYNCAPCYTMEHKEKSPDALFFVDNKLYFVEFKDGTHNKNDIRLKIHEGVTTLYMFVLKHLPQISRTDFVDLDINYAVIVRGDISHHGSSFQSALFDTSKKYNLKNLEGLMVKGTGFTSDPNVIIRFLNKLTHKKLNNMEICDYMAVGSNKTFTL